MIYRFSRAVLYILLGVFVGITLAVYVLPPTGTQSLVMDIANTPAIREAAQ